MTTRKPDGYCAYHEMESSDQPWTPCIKPTITLVDNLGSHWENDRYYGLLKKDGHKAVLSISALDNSAKHDWRDFQQLKTDLLGPQWEAIELYPSENRLVDPSNRFYLWCFNDGSLKMFGWNNGSRVVESKKAIAPQRDFANKGPHHEEEEASNEET